MFQTMAGFSVPKGAVMWGLVILMFGVTKVLTMRQVRRDGRPGSVGRTATNVLLWGGVDARGFLFGVRGKGGATNAGPQLAKLAIGLCICFIIVYALGVGLSEGGGQ